MILDQKMLKCETVLIILFLGVQKLLKCETVPIILLLGVQKLLKCETIPIILVLGVQKLLKCETVPIILLLKAQKLSHFGSSLRFWESWLSPRCSVVRCSAVPFGVGMRVVER